MKRHPLSVLFALIAFVGAGVSVSRSQNETQERPGASAPDLAPGTDRQQAQKLKQRRQQGEKLTPAEDALLTRALAEQEQRAAAVKANQRNAPERLTPLTDLGATGRYEGEDGGLYGGGRNTPPESHRQAAEKQVAQIRPLNAAGEPSTDGIIGFVAISMSNATQEFSRFKQDADASPLKSPKVTIVDLAQGGQTMASWASPDARPWQVAKERLAIVDVSYPQVQVAWIKLANGGPTGSLEEHGRKLERDTLAVLHNARRLFPNLRLAYLDSRTYGGYARGGLNPEPYAYEGAFAVRWLIQRQIKGDPELSLAKSPLVLWGPYLWAEGTKGRKVDALVWERADFADDGVHPSPAGRKKVSDLLLNFLTTDPIARRWFAKPTSPEVSETACPAEVITIAGKDDNPITAVVRKPPGPGPFPAVVLLHGGLLERPEEYLKTEALRSPTHVRFLTAGYVTVTPTFRSRAKNPQTREALDDCLAVIKYVQQMPRVSANSIVVMGGSGGGSLGLELAGEAEIRAVAAGEPASVLFTGMMTTRDEASKPLNDKIMENPKDYYTPALQQFTREKIAKVRCPILIVHGGQHAINKINDDIIIPELRAAKKAIEVVVYPGQPHGFYFGGKGDPAASEKCFNDMHAFFKRHIRVQPTPLDESLIRHVEVPARQR